MSGVGGTGSVAAVPEGRPGAAGLGLLLGPTFRAMRRRAAAAAGAGRVLTLGVVGSKHPEGIWVVLGQVATAWYFLHFIVLLPLLGVIERPLPLPESISRPVVKRMPPGSGGGPLPRPSYANPMEKP